MEKKLSLRRGHLSISDVALYNYVDASLSHMGKFLISGNVVKIHGEQYCTKCARNSQKHTQVPNVEFYK